jgi:diacylglycerol O-acyltransferase
MVERVRLGGQDALWLEMDKPGNLMVVDSLFWTAEPIDWDRYLVDVTERLWNRYPVFRSVVVRDEKAGWCWEELPDARLEDRYERVVLPEPGGDAELQQLIAAQRVAPLDRSEPLWRCVLVDNFHGGSAVLFRGHHAIADGIRMVQLSLSIFDLDPDGTPVAVPAAEELVPRVAGETGRGALATTWQVAREVVTNPVGAAHSVLTLADPLVGAARFALGALPGDVDVVRKLALGTRNDATSWTGHVGATKAIAWSPALPLEQVKTVAHAHGATVNDVLVACVAESLRAYLDKHDARCHSVTWDVPVNLKPFDPTLPVELGNGFALVQLELPTHLEDPLETLAVVRRRMGRIKHGHEAVVDYGIQALIAKMSTRVYRATVDLLANRAIGVLTNVPGPRVPLYVAGQRIVGMMGWAPLTADQVMSFTIYSYDGQVFVGIAADAGLVPEHEQIVDGFADAFSRFAVLVP